MTYIVSDGAYSLVVKIISENADIFRKRFVNFVLNVSAVRANSKYPSVRLCSSHCRTVTAKYASGESPGVNCFVKL